MMTRRIPAACVVLALFGAVPATAQTLQQERLKGLTTVTVAIKDLDDDSASCGVTTTGLTTAVNKALLDNGIKVDAVSRLGSRPILYVNVSTLYLGVVKPVGCVSNVKVELYETVRATPRHSVQPVFGEFLLADSSVLTVSSPSDHGQRIRDEVFEQVEEIAVDIRIANQ